MFASDDPERDRPALARLGARSQRCARRLRLSAVQGQRDGQQSGVLPDARRMAGALRRLDRTRRARGPAECQHLFRPPAARRRGGAGAADARAACCSGPARVPRFIKQMAENALAQRRAAGLARRHRRCRRRRPRMVDLKLHGTAIFVDAARLYALAHGIAATSTRARFAGRRPQAIGGRRTKPRPGSAASSSCRCCACGCNLRRWAAPRRESEPGRRGDAERHRPPRAEGEPARRAPPAAAHRAGLPAVSGRRPRGQEAVDQGGQRLGLVVVQHVPARRGLALQVAERRTAALRICAGSGRPPLSRRCGRPRPTAPGRRCAASTRPLRPCW